MYATYASKEKFFSDENLAKMEEFNKLYVDYFNKKREHFVGVATAFAPFAFQTQAWKADGLKADGFKAPVAVGPVNIKPPDNVAPAVIPPINDPAANSEKHWRDHALGTLARHVTHRDNFVSAAARGIVLKQDVGTHAVIYKFGTKQIFIEVENNKPYFIVYDADKSVAARALATDGVAMLMTYNQSSGVDFLKSVGSQIGPNDYQDAKKMYDALGSGNPRTYEPPKKGTPDDNNYKYIVKQIDTLAGKGIGKISKKKKEIHRTIGSGVYSYNSRHELVNRARILQGQIDAGNDNKSIRNELLTIQNLFRK